MGLMRRVESRVEKAVGAEPRMDEPRQPRNARSRKGSKLSLQPAEVARKLVKELEDHKTSGPAGTLVCHHYTVYLCPDDHKRLSAREEKVLSALERHLAKHARSKKYETLGDITVVMVMDTDLSPGYFGILAERLDRPTVPMPQQAAPARQGGAAATSGGPPSGAGDTSAAGAAAKRARRAAVKSAGSASRTPGASTSAKAAAGATEVLGPGEAAKLGLARQTIVLRTGDRECEFNHGRIILGRSRDADFRIQDPNVSRRHAAIYWADGDIVIQDLDSTNGTLVNGYPVTDTVLRPGDVVVIGDCRISVDKR